MPRRLGALASRRSRICSSGFPWRAAVSSDELIEMGGMRMPLHVASQRGETGAGRLSTERLSFPQIAPSRPKLPLCRTVYFSGRRATRRWRLD